MKVQHIAKFIDQPLIVNKISTAAPYILGGCATALGVHDVFIQKHEKQEPKGRRLRKNIVVLGTVAVASLVAAKGLKVNGKKIFDYPKPVELIDRLIQYGAPNGGIILDFFSGSATTAHAVMEFNFKNKSKIKFICVQLPEKIDEESKVFADGLKNICDIALKRIKNASEIIEKEFVEKNKILNHTKETKNPLHSFIKEWDKLIALDTGFKVFKLDSSNLKKWDNTPTKDVDVIQDRIQTSMDYIKEDRTELDLVYEVMLKYGIDLSYPVRKTENEKAYIVEAPEYKLLVCTMPNIIFWRY